MAGRLFATRLRMDGLDRVTFRLINILFAALFLISAALQYNDDEGIAWAALYFVGTVRVSIDTWGHDT